jgi:adenylate cyclase
MNAVEGRQLVSSMNRRLWVSGWLANGLGTTVVFIAVGFLLAVFFNAGERDQLGRENLPITVVAVALVGAVLTYLMSRRAARTFAWLLEGRDPSEEEQRLTLRLPGYTAALTATAWGVGSTIGFLVNLDHSFDAALLIGVAFWLGGETTSALAYLLSERTVRPATALALEARSPTRPTLGVQNRLVITWSLGTAAPMLSVLGVGIAGLVRDEVDTVALAAACVFLGTVALGTGLLATVMVARAIAEPLSAMRAAVERVRAGDLEVGVPVDDSTEVGLLQAGFNRMAEGLRERARIRDIFGRQVGEDVARSALSEGVRLGGEEREIGALFVDLSGSTSMALAMPPSEVVRLLNKFFRVVVEVVEREGGLVNKFQGDAALCVFGAPAASEDPAGEALCAARTLGRRLEREVPEIGFGIGVSAGRAVAGNVGAEQRFEYTVIGDPVNEAARLCELAKGRPERVVASDAALDRAARAEARSWEVGERTVLRGRLEATGLALPRT